MIAEYDSSILEHYRSEATRHGLEPTSTMADEITRSKEVEALLAVLGHIVAHGGEDIRVLDIGCGNGFLLEHIRHAFPSLQMVGRDYSPDMVALAQSRGIENCEIAVGDVRQLDSPDNWFDVIISERCLINLLEPSDQLAAIKELHRVLADSGTVLLLEAFTDGLANLNRARRQLGLDANEAPFHNLWFDRQTLPRMLDGLFTISEACKVSEELPGANFLSSHYFISRVVYPALTNAEIQYNTDFVQFFQFLAPIGNYAPIQLYLLQKTG